MAMNRRKIAMIGIACLAAAGASLGVAMQAHASGTAKPMKPAPAAAQPMAEPTSPDTDTLQQGDQTTPDSAAVAAAKIVKAAPKSVSAESDPAAESTSETTSEEATSESQSASDGPGGHADPPGDVQHEGGPNEQ
jgi:hypothetical protein